MREENDINNYNYLLWAHMNQIRFGHVRTHVSLIYPIRNKISSITLF